MLNKKAVLFSTLLSVFVLNCISITRKNKQTIFLPLAYPNIETAHQHFSAHKPTFLWDLHKVLFDKKISRMFLYSRPTTSNSTSSSRFTILKECIQSLLSVNTYKTLYKESQRGNKVTQAYFESVAHRPALYTAFLHIANNIYVPNQEVCTILADLKHAGYREFILSNTGPDILADFVTQYPEIFDNFTSKQNSINSTMLHKDGQVTSYTGSWLFKPQPEAYKAAIKRSGAAANDHIFIDNKLKNVIAAQKEGIVGILFINPAQLRDNLQALGIKI